MQGPTAHTASTHPFVGRDDPDAPHTKEMVSSRVMLSVSEASVFPVLFLLSGDRRRILRFAQNDR